MFPTSLFLGRKEWLKTIHNCSTVDHTMSSSVNRQKIIFNSIILLLYKVIVVFLFTSNPHCFYNYQTNLTMEFSQSHIIYIWWNLSSYQLLWYTAPHNVLHTRAWLILDCTQINMYYYMFIIENNVFDILGRCSILKSYVWEVRTTFDNGGS